jgi:hypothetical protein
MTMMSTSTIRFRRWKVRNNLWISFDDMASSRGFYWVLTMGFGTAKRRIEDNVVAGVDLAPLQISLYMVLLVFMP